MKIQSSNATDIEKFYEKGRFMIAWRLSMLFALVFSALSVATINQNYEEAMVYLICVVIACALLVYLRTTKNSKLVYYVMVTFGTFIAGYGLLCIHNVVHLVDFLWMILIITLAFFGLGVKHGIIVLLLNLMVVSYFSLFRVNIYVEEINALSYAKTIGLSIEIAAAFLSISYIIYQFVVFHQYAYNKAVISNRELSNQNAVISAQNLENRTLVMEIHHRVKNNLQIVISLLRLQKAELKSTEAENHFSEAINRIMVMSLIHKKLYQEGELATIELQTYLSDLAEDILALATLKTPVEIDVQSQIDKVGLKTIVPLGLIINELISNSIRHAFKEKNTGNIAIRLTNDVNGQFTLSYSDDGKWIEPEADHSSFGLELLEIITEQLEGEFTRETNDNGTSYTFRLTNVADDEESKEV